MSLSVSIIDENMSVVSLAYLLEGVVVVPVHTLFLLECHKDTHMPFLFFSLLGQVGPIFFSSLQGMVVELYRSTSTSYTCETL